MANFEQALQKLLKHEGGYAKVAGDKGGLTYAGITQKNHPDWLGWSIVTSKPRKHNEQIPELSAMVHNFYKQYYWDKVKAGEICNDKVAEFLFDWYVNSGSHAPKAIQKIVGVAADGIIGAQSIKSINNYPGNLFGDLKQARIDFVNRIVANDPSQKKFLKGWMNRIESFK